MFEGIIKKSNLFIILEVQVSCSSILIKFIAFYTSHQILFMFLFCSTVQEFRTIYKAIVEEMRILANDSEFGEEGDSSCDWALNNYIEKTNHFMDLVRLASFEEFTRDAQNISQAILDFLYLEYLVSDTLSR